LVSGPGSAWWITAWSGEDGVRQALLARKLERQGAAIAKGALNIAVAPLRETHWDSPKVGGTTFVIGGSAPPLEELARLFADDIWRQCLHAGRMAPSERFLRWLHEGNRSLIYRRADVVGHEGLVAITPAPADPTAVCGDVATSVAYGADAQTVWLAFHRTTSRSG
jgi:hypothetical protein